MIGFTNISSLGGETVPRRWVSAARRVSILFPARYPAFALHVAALAACSLIAGMPASRAEAVGPMRRIMAFPGPCRDPAIDNAKSHKLFFYFPTAADATFPNYGANVSPAQPFDVGGLDPTIGTTAELINEIAQVAIDDYCEFNVQVLPTTTNPATIISPPARRATVAIGSDVNGTSSGGTWGMAQEVDIGDQIDIDFARVWAGTYTVCEGGTGPPPTCTPGGSGCSMTGALTGANSTLARWAQAIGGTASHEGGHTYGLAHSDDDPPTDPCQPGPGPAPGEDAFNLHMMPAGYDLTGPDRTNFRRHFSDRDYGILATNVGLSVETMHNWDLVNPNAQQASSLAIDFLSQLPSISISWTYAGSTSPWLNPTVAGPSGTAIFKGMTYNKYRITWSAGNPAWTTPSPGVVAGGAEFHIGASFTGVDFTVPDPIIITDVTLLDAGSNPLTLHPRLPSYDAGTLDSATRSLVLNFFPPAGAPQLRLASATILQLPRFATIDALVGAGRPFTREGRPIRPWTGTSCAPGPLRQGIRCTIARLDQPPHVQDTFLIGQPGVIDCRQGRPGRGPGSAVPPGDSTNRPDYEGPVIQPPANPPRPGARDSVNRPDFEGPICAGVQRDPFPSAVIYVTASFVDPNARHFDPVKKAFVVGPVISKLYYQFAGIRQLPQGLPGPGSRSR